MFGNYYGKKNKYGNKKTTVNGIEFASRKEAKRYSELLLLEKSDVIEKLERQPRFILQHGFKLNGKNIRAIEYVADFKYKKTGGNWVVEDVKGFKTSEYNLKKKIFSKLYGGKYEFIEIN